MAKIVGIDLGTTKKLFINKFVSSPFKQSFQGLLMRRFFLGSEFNSHNIGNDGQSSGNDKQSIAHSGTINDVTKLFRSHFEYRSKIMAMIMLTIPRVMDFVNVAGSKLIKPGPIKIRANHPADRLPKIPDETLKNEFLTAATLTNMRINYNGSKASLLRK